MKRHNAKNLERFIYDINREHLVLVLTDGGALAGISRADLLYAYREWLRTGKNEVIPKLKSLVS